MSCKTCRLCHKSVGPADRQHTNQIDLCISCYDEGLIQPPLKKKM